MSVFEDVKSTLNIREVIEFYGIKVNRAGKFLCPFHQEKTESASIKNDYFHCFGCGVGGDLIKFTALLFGLNNLEACKKLIADFGLNIQVGKPQNALDKLRAEITANERKKEQARRTELEEQTRRTGQILAEYHYYLWEGKTTFPFGHPRHTEALNELDYIQYLDDCYTDAPEKFSRENREVVEHLERKLYRSINENE